MPKSPLPDERRVERLRRVLEKLAKQGIPQQEVAARAGLPSQFLSDLKNGRRVLGELVARRLAEEFRFNYHWLLTGQGTMSESRSSMRQGRRRPLPQPHGGALLLPVLPNPTAGAPRAAPSWDGSMVAVTGPAAERAHQVAEPYVLRLASDDPAGRLRAGDLLLISQGDLDAGDIRIVQAPKRLVLARRGKGGAWTPLAKEKSLPPDSAVVGTCIGIIWAPL